MKSYFLLALLTTIAISCNDDFDQVKAEKPSSIQTTYELVTTEYDDTHLVAQELVKAYMKHLNSHSPLAQKISKLDNISSLNPVFIALKTADYQVITEADANVFLGDVELVYANLALSKSMKDYLNDILEPNTDLQAVYKAVSKDKTLNPSQLKLLEFIINSLQSDFIVNGNDDDSWRKNMIVGIVLGMQQNTAQAIFNVSLLKISVF